MFTVDDIKTVFEYNKRSEIFRVTDTKRVVWSVNNGNKQYLNDTLSRPVKTAEDFAQLKKQVKNELKSQGIV
jgi:hypothetical protein